MSEPTLAADLVAFLRARLDEDEQVAQAAEPGPWEVEYDHTSDVGPGWFAVAVATVGADGDRTNPEQVDPVHIARWDPARVLRDVEAKREILEEHEPVPHALTVEEGGGSYLACAVCPHPRIDVPHVLPCRTLRLLALSDAGHPDYREEWKP